MSLHPDTASGCRKIERDHGSRREESFSDGDKRTQAFSEGTWEHVATLTGEGLGRAK